MQSLVGNVAAIIRRNRVAVTPSLPISHELTKTTRLHGDLLSPSGRLHCQLVAFVYQKRQVGTCFAIASHLP